MEKLKSNTAGNLFIIFGIINILYFLVCTITYRMYINFTGFFVALGVVFILLGLIYKKCKFKKAYYVFRVILCLILCVFVFTEAILAYNGKIEYKGKLDYIVVLGAGLRGKTMLSTQYQRAQRAMEYVKDNPDIKIVVSGGKGSGESITEAESMKEYFLNKGVKNENIIVEDKSKNTFQNLKNTKNILDKISNGKNIKVGVVTSNFHMTRAKLLGKRVGLKLYGIPAPIKILVIPQCYVREFFAIYKSLIFDR
ncbi:MULTISPECIES: YdcF family protein [Clostridium]|uniref:YdcF family protein n=1 Tax=Clostridium TaxID=1485 RepID=UPI000826ED0C|nr:MULTISPECIES: YdcF family protein [Clostridium]PJI07911.1 YdcF family protein [Clostridium sp. CT7]